MSACIRYDINAVIHLYQIRLRLTPLGLRGQNDCKINHGFQKRADFSPTGFRTPQKVLLLREKNDGALAMAPWRPDEFQKKRFHIAHWNEWAFLSPVNILAKMLYWQRCTQVFYPGRHLQIWLQCFVSLGGLIGQLWLEAGVVLPGEHLRAQGRCDVAKASCFATVRSRAVDICSLGSSCNSRRTFSGR